MHTDPKARTSFFDDDNLQIVFTFKKFEKQHKKLLEATPLITSTLTMTNLTKNNLAPLQTTFALHGRTLVKYPKGSMKTPESILEIAHSRLKELPQNGTNSNYGFSLAKNGATYEFHSPNKSEIDDWVGFLKNFCVLGQFHSEYKAIKIIGKGSFAKVYLVESKIAGKTFAVKSFVKENVITSAKGSAKPAMLNEIDIMRSLQHDNIIKLYEVYETEKSIYLVMELIEGKPLQDVLQKPNFKEKYSEEKVMKMIYSILDALSYLSSKGIMHRDLKPDNILVGKDDKIKIVDFGLATYIDLPEYIFGKCGTPGYLAPEVLKYDQKNKKTFYDHRCDAFSAGCILFYMLFGKRFFEGNDGSEVLLHNRKFNELDSSSVSLAKAELKNPHGKISKEGIKLLLQLVEYDPNKRITSSKALFHSYFNAIYSGEDKSLNISDEDIPLSKREFFMSEHVLPSLRESLGNTAAPLVKSRFTEKNSLYLDVGKPDMNGRVDTLVGGSNTNSLLLVNQTTSNEGSREGSLSSFAKLGQDIKKERSFRAHNAGNGQSFLKAAIFRNMQKNNEVQGEEVKEETLQDNSLRYNKHQVIELQRNFSAPVSRSDSSCDSEIDFENDEDNIVGFNLQKLKAEAGVMLPSMKAHFMGHGISRRRDSKS